MKETLITIKQLVSEAQYYEVIRTLRWQRKVSCPHGDSLEIIKRGYHDQQSHRQRYECKTCQKRFDDLSETVLARHHQPLSVWIL